MPGDRIWLHRPDEVYEKLLTRMCGAGWIDVIVERAEEDTPLHFHFTARGKERFRALVQMARELENGRDLMSASERAELLAMGEAWIQDVEEQRD